MSAFAIGDTHYEKPYDEQEPTIRLGGGRQSMDVSVNSTVGTVSNEEFTDEYDVGSTTVQSASKVDL
ncbi:hypothetical protein [Halostagnicola bangensis]